MKLKDNSVDVLGILQHSSIHNGLTMHLYTKPQIILMCSLLKSHQLILYYDPTGQMLSLKNCGFSKHILHSKLSFCPEEMYVDKKKRTVSANCFMASVLAELFRIIKSQMHTQLSSSSCVRNVSVCQE